ncbi:hypothetical protein SAMN05660464_2575 [Geodermatophilus dictyosporus]|uniref:Uncharacterized protein n=1 Tax=Geodermatophilus dictyosporus TaxID=1523247 RepID=A0A1I5NKM7_9ACTN|nr:hypothetical protein [Geodermatophilus dictyosporus]SFP22355.1 hypothetical protein SAMN05660464_2575 [Geodermatophilus dictyosporus]
MRGPAADHQRRLTAGMVDVQDELRLVRGGGAGVRLQRRAGVAAAADGGGEAVTVAVVAGQWRRQRRRTPAGAPARLRGTRHLPLTTSERVLTDAADGPA